METLLNSYKVSQCNEYISLDDVVKNIIKSKTPKVYINKISKKVKIDGKYYITVEHLIQKLETCKNKESKTFLTELKKTLEPQEEENSTPSYEDLYYEEKHRQQLKALERKDGCKELEGTFIDIRNNYFSYKGKEVMIIQKDNEVWFKGNDVAKLLEYENHHQALQLNVSQVDKVSFEDLKTYYYPIFKSKRNYSLQKNTIFINYNGFLTLLAKSLKPINVVIAQKFGLNLVNYKHLRKEQKHLEQIIRVFGNHNKYELQYNVDGYRIDIYFPEIKLAIECDEFGHRNYQQDEEKIREEHIRNKLNCTFIRFNPDDTNFDIIGVISQIYHHINRFKS